MENRLKAPVKFLLTVPRQRFCCGLLFLSLYVLHVCPGEIFILDSCLANVGKETVLLAFCLQCFDCGAIAFSVPFFPFGILDGRC